MLEELAQRHRVPGLGLVGKALADGVVEGEQALVDELEGYGSAERLGDAGDAHVVVGVRSATGRDVADPGRVHLRTVAAGEQGDRPGWAVVLGDQPVELPLEALVMAPGPSPGPGSPAACAGCSSPPSTAAVRTVTDSPVRRRRLRRARARVGMCVAPGVRGDGRGGRCPARPSSSSPSGAPRVRRAPRPPGWPRKSARLVRQFARTVPRFGTRGAASDPPVLSVCQ